MFKNSSVIIFRISSLELNQRSLKKGNNSGKTRLLTQSLCVVSTTFWHSFHNLVDTHSSSTFPGQNICHITQNRIELIQYRSLLDIARLVYNTCLIVSPGKVLHTSNIEKKVWHTGDTFKLIRNSTKTKVSGEKQYYTTQRFL